MQHGHEFFIVLTLGIILFLGAIMRFFCKHIKIPYTLSMLLAGLFSGFIIDFFGGDDGLFGLFQLPKDEPVISSGLIIFVFLPALIFEAAFALDYHTFKKSLGVISLLAGPAFILNTLLVATLVMWLTPESWGWGWLLALSFGSLISATDPVAVTAILRELGLSKALVTIIEGESLLNDGTSIVFFSAILSIISMGSLESSVVALNLVKVILGGALVGILLAWGTSSWLSRIFDDPLLEIILTLILGYFAMIIAEGLLHVSGVIALVIAGQWMTCAGKMRIGHEVKYFLHQFWEMLAYITNTVIFFLVGLTIASQLEKASFHDFFLISMVYSGIMVIRFLVTFFFQAFFSSMGLRLSFSHTFIISWSGLRGAVSLALALLLFHQEYIPAPLRSQALLLTAGVVFLSILVNGSTVKFFLKLWNIDKPPLPERVLNLLVQSMVLDRVYGKIQAFSKLPQLHTFTWSDIKVNIHSRQLSLQKKISKAENEQEKGSYQDRLQGYWMQTLSIEKEAYWEAFRQGTLEERAAKILIHEVEMQLTRGVMPPPEKRIPDIKGIASSWTNKIFRRYAFLHRYLEAMEFSHISMLYNLAHGLEIASKTVLDKINAITKMEPEIQESIKTAYRRYLHGSKKKLEEMRQYLPRVTRSIESNLAKRIALIQERNEYQNMLHKGLIEEQEAKSLISTVENQMKILTHQLKKRKAIPTAADLLREMNLFRSWTEEDRKLLARHAVNVILSPENILFKEGDKGDSLFIISSGAINVIKKIQGKDEIISVLGGGDIMGEMSLLTGQARSATLQAATTVSLVRIDRKNFMAVAEKHPSLFKEAWIAYSRHSLDNFLREHPDYSGIPDKIRKNWIYSGEFEKLANGIPKTPTIEKKWTYIVFGEVEIKKKTYISPSLIPLDSISALFPKKDSIVIWLPKQVFPDL